MNELLTVVLLGLFPGLIGMVVEYLFYKIRILRVLPPVATVIGMIAFHAYDERHAQELLASGVMPEALGYVLGMSLLGGLLVGIAIGWYLGYRKNNMKSNQDDSK